MARDGLRACEDSDVKVQVIAPVHEAIVDLQTAIGTVRGKWKGASYGGGTAHIEFTFHRDAVIGDNARLTDQQACSAHIRDGSTVLVGLVEDVDDDGVFYLRLDLDCLSLVSAAPGAFSAGQWVELRCAPSELDIYPFG